VGVALLLAIAVMNGGRSAGTGGRSLLLAGVRKACSRELDEFRDEDRVAIWPYVSHTWDGKGSRTCLTRLRRLAAPHRFSISLQ
jgi:hypothetical protein